ncbi:PIH1 domain-containing protein 1 [Phlyctochytrium bullatum]|nr:PIH1 domain-containing protein 1 [Phlyctochytrium bullatum]
MEQLLKELRESTSSRGIGGDSGLFDPSAMAAASSSSADGGAGGGDEGSLNDVEEMASVNNHRMTPAPRGLPLLFPKCSPGLITANTVAFFQNAFLQEMAKNPEAAASLLQTLAAMGGAAPNQSAAEGTGFTDGTGASKSNIPPGMMEIVPNPGFVFKTRLAEAKGEWGKGWKVFINVCHHEVIPPPPDASLEEIAKAAAEGNYGDYKMPLSLAGPHVSKDKAGATCLVFEACMCPSSVHKAKHDLAFQGWIAELCFEWLEEKHKISLEREYTLPKMKAKGTLSTHVVRKSIKPKVTEVLKDPPPKQQSVPTTSKPKISPVEPTPKPKPTTSTPSPAPKLDNAAQKKDALPVATPAKPPASPSNSGQQPDAKSKAVFLELDSPKTPDIANIVSDASPKDSTAPLLQDGDVKTIPKYTLEFSPKTQPTHVSVVIDLPDVPAPSQTALLQYETDKVYLLANPESTYIPPYPYRPLEVHIPFTLDVEGQVEAGFDRSTRVLKVTVPILRASLAAWRRMKFVFCPVFHAQQMCLFLVHTVANCEFAVSDFTKSNLNRPSTPESIMALNVPRHRAAVLTRKIARSFGDALARASAARGGEPIDGVVIDSFWNLETPSDVTDVLSAIALAPTPIRHLNIMLMKRELLEPFLTSDVAKGLTSMQLMVSHILDVHSVAAGPPLPNLQELSLTAVSSPYEEERLKGLEFLKRFPNLKYVITSFDAGNESFFGAATLKAYVEHAPFLETIVGGGTGGYTAHELDHFMSRMHNLKSVALEFIDTDAWVDSSVAHAPWWSRLTTFSVTAIDYGDVGTDEVIAMIKNLKEVRQLSVLAHDDGVMDIVKAVKEHCPKIESLELVQSEEADEPYVSALEWLLRNKPAHLKRVAWGVFAMNPTGMGGSPCPPELVNLAGSAGVAVAWEPVYEERINL